MYAKHYELNEAQHMKLIETMLGYETAIHKLVQTTNNVRGFFHAVIGIDDNYFHLKTLYDYSREPIIGIVDLRRMEYEEVLEIQSQLNSGDATHKHWDLGDGKSN